MKLFSKELLYRMLPFTWTQPTLTSNGTMGGSTMAVDWDAGPGNKYGTPAWQAFSPNNTDIGIYRDEAKTWIKVYIYIPKKVRARSISFYNLATSRSSSAFYNTKFYGGNWKGDERELLLDIGTAAENATYTGAMNTSSEYQYFELYFENGGWAYEDRISMKNINFTAEYDDFI